MAAKPVSIATAESSLEPITKEKKLELCAVFESVKLTEFPAPILNERKSGVVELSADATVKQAADLLAKYDILAAPVRAKETAAKRKDYADWVADYMGVFGVGDVVTLMLEIVEAKGESRAADATGRHLAPPSMWQESFQQTAASLDQLNSTTVGQRMKATQATPFWPMSQNSTLLDLMVLLGKYRCHRVCLVDDSKLVNIITQSAVIRMLQRNLSNPLIAAFAKHSLKSAGLAQPKEVFSVSRDQPVVDAFRLMQEKQVSGVPVVDDNGLVIGNISLRDIRAMIGRPDLFRLMYSSCHDLIRHVMAGKEKHLEAHMPALCIYPEHTISHVIDKFAALRVHRLFLVDRHGKLTGVVSLSDLIGAFVIEPNSAELEAIEKAAGTYGSRSATSDD